MLSLISHLSFATKVVPEGRPFLHRMINLASTQKCLNSHIRENSEFRSDLSRWHLILDGWNGISCLQTHTNASPDHTFYTDASGTWGCGATEPPQWFHLQWPPAWSCFPITTKELLPIIVAVAVWGRRWAKKHILCRCDNMAVVHILHTHSSKDHVISFLLRSLHFFLAHWDIQLMASHIPGKLNKLADALSCNHMQVFHREAPTADQRDSHVPSVLQEMLITRRPDWTSQAWESCLKSLWNMV